MPKVYATYNAPTGDAEVVTMRAVRFFDGQPVELDPDEHAALIGKLRRNWHFSFEEAEDSSNGGVQAIHRGRGVYAVTDNGNVLDHMGTMSKDDADAFNALTDAEKVALVTTPKEPQA